MCAERWLALEGSRNFRDLGGYETADGRAVRWGRMFRSGSLADRRRWGVDWNRQAARAVCSSACSAPRGVSA